MSASFRRIERRPPGQRPGPAAGGGGGGGGAGIGPAVGAVTASAAAPLRAPGTRPWVNGQSLVSSGNRDLDVVLGGGLCLGTLTLLEEDRFSEHALCLARYFVAQGVSLGQRTLVVGAEGRAALGASVAEGLPYDLTYKKETATAAAVAAQAVQEQQRQQPGAAPLATIEEGEDDGAENGGGCEGLSIAWQYRKYLGDSGSGSSSTAPSGASFCHSYDLSRPMQAELLAGETRRPRVLDAGELDLEGCQYVGVYKEVERAVQELPPRTVLRVLVKSLLDRRGAWDAGGWRQALHLLRSLRTLAATSPVVVLVTMPAHHLESAHQRRLFSRVADTVLEVDSFAGKRHQTPSEFEAFAGILYIKALQHPHALAPVRGPSNKMGIKRDRRKLHIEPLHLPPEGVRVMTEDVERAKGKKKGHPQHRGSAAAMLCATSGGAVGGAVGGAGGGALDF